MEDLLTKEIQITAYSILKSFHDACEKNNIQYSLAYGTLLGAVRHGGFIPWDDDIDVFMLRSEYEKFKAVYKSEDFELVDSDIDGKYPYLFPKIRKKGTVLIENNISDLNYNIGLYIDIFVLDEVPEGLRAALKKAEFVIKYKMYRLCTLNISSIGRVLRIPARLLRKCFPYNKLAKSCGEVYKNQKGNLLRDASMLDERTYLTKEDMSKLELLSFGAGAFMGTSNYDSLLTRHYNAYMNLPPENERVSNHSFYKIEL